MYSDCKADLYDIQQLFANKPESLPLEIDLESSSENDHLERRPNTDDAEGGDPGEGAAAMAAQEGDRGKEGEDSEDSDSEQSDVDDSNESETDVTSMQSQPFSNNLF